MLMDPYPTIFSQQNGDITYTYTYMHTPDVLYPSDSPDFMLITPMPIFVVVLENRCIIQIEPRICETR